MKNLFLLFMGVSFLVISSCEKKPDITSENKDILNRVEVLWNTGDLAKIDDMFGTDFVNHDPNAPDVNDLEGYKEFIVMTRTAFPDFHVTSEDMIAEGDKVVSRWTAQGTQQGELLGIAPTSKHATWTGISIYRFADGKIVEAWWFKDMLGLLQQLMVILPMPDGPPFMDRKPEEYLWGEPSAVTGYHGDPEANKALYLREIEEVWHQGNLDVVDDIFSTNFVNHDPYWGAPDRRSYKQWVASQLPSAPRLTVDDIVAEGNRLACRWTSRFTDPASGKQVKCVGVDICRFADGKIVERWWSKDILGVLQQLGVIPPPEQGG